MNLIFTICSVNYLASAKCLWQSVKKTNSELKFIYVIADKINGRVDKNYFEGVDYVEVEDLDIPNLNELINTYNLIEFNTAIKPFAANYVNKKYSAQKLIYFDPDIIVFNSLDFIWENLNNYDFILTPHLTQPTIDDLFYQHQKGALNTGTPFLAPETRSTWFVPIQKQPSAIRDLALLSTSERTSVLERIPKT